MNNATEIEKPAPTMVTETPSATTGGLPAPAPLADDAHEIMEIVLMRGDLSKLTPAERNRYYIEVCKSIGLNPLTRPMDFMTLNGKLVLYVKRDGADQLRNIHGINLEIVNRRLDGELYEVHVRAINKDGRRDEDFGVVALGQTRGEMRANLMLKCVTKAKRRATLSICGLGFLDETEIEDIPPEDKLVSAPRAHPSLANSSADFDHEDDEVADVRSRSKFQAMRHEIDALIDSGIGPSDLVDWGSAIEPRTRDMTEKWKAELRNYFRDALKELQKKEAEDGLQPSVLKHEDAPTISERAEAARDRDREQVSGRPSRSGNK